ncbi:hypothetical protein BH23GEM9_BH23GEM9_21590 [soil metagenome]
MRWATGDRVDGEFLITLAGAVQAAAALRA